MRRLFDRRAGRAFTTMRRRAGDVSLLRACRVRSGARLALHARAAGGGISVGAYRTIFRRLLLRGADGVPVVGKSRRYSSDLGRFCTP